jgi:hypothetical protein
MDKTTESLAIECESAYGPATIRREFLPDENLVAIFISPEPDVEWPAYFTPEQWAALTA